MKTVLGELSERQRLRKERDRYYRQRNAQSWKRGTQEQGPEVACQHLITNESDRDFAARRHLQPQLVPASRNLQDYARSNGWASSYPTLAPATLHGPDTSPAHRIQQGYGPSGMPKDSHPMYIPEPSFEQCHEEVFDDGDGVTLKPMANTDMYCGRPHADVGMEVARLTFKQSVKADCWWTALGKPSVCPLSGFPINLLSNPPFILRQRTPDPTVHSLVDGKYLALMLIASGRPVVKGHRLELPEVRALGEHNRHIKFGPHRLDVALNLLIMVQDANQNDRAESFQVLRMMQAAAQYELDKLQRFQGQVLLQLRAQLSSSAEVDESKKFYKQASEWSISTCASGEPPECPDFPESEEDFREHVVTLHF